VTLLPDRKGAFATPQLATGEAASLEESLNLK